MYQINNFELFNRWVYVDIDVFITVTKYEKSEIVYKRKKLLFVTLFGIASVSEIEFLVIITLQCNVRSKKY